ncbi:MAG: HAD hydrolase family protein [Deltaproteobacteria bacterium]|jgi:3-deoxy-D-manno-octulosonate 8-phosphate phosphatase (KDO 8-P phosphatase)|nr:HAD hydrolase family protein [Deltaproteobacteria bacterium]
MPRQSRPKKVIEAPILADIAWVGFDVDGVMTDGGIYLAQDGTEMKRFHSRDGHALKILIRSGIKVSIITGRKSPLVELRAKEVGITSVYQGISDKLQVYQEILSTFGLTPQEAAFAGDDMVDLPVMFRVALPMAPANASPEALAAAKFISKSPGGHGAVREMVEFILKGKGLWDSTINPYLA